MGIVKSASEMIALHLAYANKIELCFNNAARECKDFSRGPLTSDFAREIFRFCRKCRISEYGRTQSMAVRILCRAGFALPCFWTSACLSIGTIGSNFSCAGHATFSRNFRQPAIHHWTHEADAVAPRFVEERS
jgi:hypothetical protein